MAAATLDLCECPAPYTYVLDGDPFCDGCGRLVVHYSTVRGKVVNRTPSAAIKTSDPRPPLQHANPYIYHPLEEGQIRLLILDPGSFRDDIQCTIVHADFNNLPQFDAISYTWADETGDATHCSQIYCGRRRNTISVTANCEAVLRRVRLQNIRRLVWIDAICINQDFVAERNHQVQSMSRIYKEASGVLVYLGEDAEDSDMLFGFIGSIPNFLELEDMKNPSVEVVASLNRAFNRLTSRRWFSRIWAVPEFVVARRGEWICGNQNAGFACLSLSNLRKIGLQTPTDSNGLLSVVDNSDVGGRSLWDLVQITEPCNSADPRDRIFALRGLIGHLKPDELVPDYDKSTAAVYTEAAVYLVRATRSPNILFLRAGRNLPSISMPSWVPDFSYHGRMEPYVTIDVDESAVPIRFYGNMATVLPNPVGFDNPSLEVSAVSLGDVVDMEAINGAPTDTTYSRLFEDWAHKYMSNFTGWQCSQETDCYLMADAVEVLLLARCLEDWSDWMKEDADQERNLLYVSRLISEILRPTWWWNIRPSLLLGRVMTVEENQDLIVALLRVRTGDLESTKEFLHILATVPPQIPDTQMSSYVRSGAQLLGEESSFSVVKSWESCGCIFIREMESQAWTKLFNFQGHGRTNIPSRFVLPSRTPAFGRINTCCYLYSQQLNSLDLLLAGTKGNDWRLFCTSESIGFCPMDSQLGDSVFSIAGASYLVVLRPFNDGYRYVGPCFMLGAEFLRKRSSDYQRISIY